MTDNFPTHSLSNINFLIEILFKFKAFRIKIAFPFFYKECSTDFVKLRRKVREKTCNREVVGSNPGTRWNVTLKKKTK